MIDGFKKLQDFTWNLPLNSTKGFVWEVKNDFFEYDLWQQEIPMLPAALQKLLQDNIIDRRCHLICLIYDKDENESGCEYTDAD